MLGTGVFDERTNGRLRLHVVGSVSAGALVRVNGQAGLSANCQIATDRGLVPLASVAEGDRVRLGNDLSADIIAVLETPASHDQRDGPLVSIPTGALGQGAPDADLVVGLDQGVCLPGGRAMETYCGAREVICLAKDLVGWAGCSWAERKGASLIQLVFGSPTTFQAHGMHLAGFEPREATLAALPEGARSALRKAAPHFFYPSGRAAQRSHLPRLHGAEVRRVLTWLNADEPGARVSVLGSGPEG